MVLANRQGLATVRVEDCHNRALIVGYLARCAHRGVSVLACWRNVSRSKACAVSLNAADKLPTLRTYTTSDPRQTDQSLTLIMSQCFDLRPHFHADVAAKQVIQSIAAADMQAAGERALEHGLTVDRQIWARLKEVATGVLVDDGL